MKQDRARVVSDADIVGERESDVVRVCSSYVTEMTRATIEEASEDVEDEPLAVFKLICTLAEYYISTYLFDPPPPSASTATSAPPLTLLSPSVHTLFSLLISLSTFPGHSPDSSYTINELPTGSWMALQEYGADVGFTLNGQFEEGWGEAEWQVYKGIWNALKDGLRNRAVRPKLSEFQTWPKGKFSYIARKQHSLTRR